MKVVAANYQDSGQGAVLDEHLKYLVDRQGVSGYIEPADFIKLPFDQDILAQVKTLAQAKNPGGVKWVILVGIGGSSLGAEAVYHGLVGNNKLIQLTVADTVDPVALAGVMSSLNATTLTAEELVVVIVSKSGQTVEVADNAALIVETLISRFGNELALSRVVVVSDRESPLWNLAIDKKIEVLAIPESVGGRFSVFSAAGLLPLCLCGVNIDELLLGARVATESLADDVKASAITLDQAYRSGKNIHDFFVFSKELEEVGKWYRQLLAESLGKDGFGLTPTVSIGSTDLHSQAQLVFGGPKDKVTTLVSVELPASDPVVPTDAWSALAPGLAGKSLGQVLAAIYQGTKEAYQEAELPIIEIRLEALSAKEIGAMMQFLLFQVICVAKLWGVDPYNQPAVENYKTKAKQILST